MEAKYYDALPKRVQHLVDEIQAACQAEIVVQHDPDESAMRCWPERAVNGKGIRGVIKYGDSVCLTTEIYRAPYMVFTHELLHLKRYLVERAPIAVFPEFSYTPARAGVPEPAWCSTPWGRNMAENLLEHIHIDPRLSAYGFPRPEMSGFLTRWWNRLAAIDPRRADPRVLVWGLAFKALETEFLTDDPGVRHRAEKTVKKFGGLKAMYAARDAAKAMRACIAMTDPIKGKAAMVDVFCHHAGVPRDLVRLVDPEGKCS